MTKINHFIFGNKIYSNIVIFVFIVFVSNQCFDTIEISSLLPVSISQKNITSQGKINESSSLKTSKQSAIVPAIAVAPGEQLEVRCLAQGLTSVVVSKVERTLVVHSPHRQLLPDPIFEPTTSGYKSYALSIWPRLPLFISNRTKKKHYSGTNK